MTNLIDNETKVRHLQSLCAQLAGVCDGAATRDDQGFNGTDARFGRILGTTEPEAWSAKMFNIALKMLPKYHTQVDTSALKGLSPLPEERGSVIAAERRKAAEELGADFTAKVSSLPESNDDLPLKWGRAKNVKTRRGLRGLRKAEMTSEFRKLWRENQTELRNRGLSLTQGMLGSGRSALVCDIVCWWGEPVEDEMTRFERKAKEALPELQVLPPAIAERLRTYQVPGTQRLRRGIQHWNAVMDGSDTGTGKTYKALAAILAEGGTPVVVCPLAIIPGWHKAARHFGTQVIAINYESVKTGKTELGTMEVVERVNNNGKTVKDYVFTWTLEHIQSPVLVFDEVHKCKNPKSQNAALLAAADRQGIKVLMLSATAAISPLDMQVIGSTLHLFPKSSKGFWSWARQHGVASNGYGQQFQGTAEHLEAIHQEIYGAGRGDRTRIADLPDFPACSFETNLVNYGAQTKEIDKAAKELAEALEALRARASADKDPELVLTRILRARQRLEILRAPTWAKLAADEITEGRSVVIFCAFNETIDLLADLLQTDCIIQGGQSPKERERQRLIFQNNESHVILVNVNAGGQALDLHDLMNRARTSFLSPDFNARMVVQAIGRIRRDGALSPSIVKFFYAAGTVEESMAETCQEKINNITLINDGNIDDVVSILARDIPAAA